MAESGMTSTQFHQFVIAGNLEEVKHWLELHPEFLDLPNSIRRTPLHLAAGSGREEMVDFLIAAGSQSILALDQWGMTPLRCACEGGHYTTSELLIRAGKSGIDIPSKEGTTPLLAAIRHGHRSIVELLLRSGSQALDTPLNFGTTPIWMALGNGHKSIAIVLQAVGAILPPELQLPIPEEEVLAIRNRIYFERSLLDRLLF